MTTTWHHLHVEETVRDAIELMQTGRYRNVPLLDDEDHPPRRGPAPGHPEVPRRGVPRGAPQPTPTTPPAHAQGRGRMNDRMTTETRAHDPELQELDRVTIRFAGDSGDGMQLTGTQFTRTAAVYGNDISTLPDFPAEIRAPAGSLPGVSGFQISFSSNDIHTPGDQPDVLVAMNPAALKTNVVDLPAGGALIVNSDAFTPAEPEQGRLRANPLTDGSLKQFTVFEIPISTLNERSLDGLDMTSKQKDLTKNFFALGIMFWLYGRETRPDGPLDRRQVRQAAGHRGGEQAGPQGRLRVRRDDRDLPHPLPRRAGQAAARRLPQHHRQRGDRARVPDRVEARAAGRCSTAPTRSRRPPTSSTSCRATRTSASRRSRPRTRSRRSARRSARPTAGRWA